MVRAHRKRLVRILVGSLVVMAFLLMGVQF